MGCRKAPREPMARGMRTISRFAATARAIILAAATLVPSMALLSTSASAQAVDGSAKSTSTRNNDA